MESKSKEEQKLFIGIKVEQDDDDEDEAYQQFDNNVPPPINKQKPE
jgi:hypothetical protein